MEFEVQRGLPQEDRIVLELAQTDVTVVAEKRPKLPGLVTVVPMCAFTAV
jgi:hypothetical protein